jgi:hypothetical protein
VRSLRLPFSLWTLQRLVDYLAEHLSIRVSDETVRRALKRADIVLSRPQYKISRRDPEYPIKKTIEDARDHLQPRKVFYSADGCNARWLPTLRALWSPRGQQAMIPTPGQPYKRYGLGAVNSYTDETVVLFRRRKCCREVAERFQALVAKPSTGTIDVVWAHADTHADEQD